MTRRGEGVAIELREARDLCKRAPQDETGKVREIDTGIKTGSGVRIGTETGIEGATGIGIGAETGTDPDADHQTDG